MLQVTQLEAVSFMGLNAVTIQVDEPGKVTRLVGPNGAGKSSLLNAVGTFFTRANQYPKDPIKDGESKATIKLSVRDDIEEMLGFDAYMTFRRTEEGVVEDELKIVRLSGSTITTGAATFLRKLIGNYMISPTEFLNEKEDKQFKMIAGLVDFGLDLDKWEATRKTLEAERKDLNVGHKSKASTLDNLRKHDDAPDAKVDIGEIAKQLEDANEKVRIASHTEQSIQNLLGVVARKEHIISEMNGKIAVLQVDIKQVAGEISDLTAVHGEQKAEIPDVTGLSEKIESASAVNQKVTDNETYKQHKEIADKLKAAHGRKDEEFKAHKKTLAEALAKVEFPIDGIWVDPETVNLMWGKSLFKQASGAQQLLAACELYMLKNKDSALKLITIPDGAVADQETVAMLEKLFEENGFHGLLEQPLMHDSQTGIIIRDGSVAGVNK